MKVPEQVRKKKSTKKKWLAGCGIGCAAVVLVTIIGLGVGSYFLQQPFKEAITTRETLKEQFGAQADYVPAPDGAIAPQRVMAFLAVREQLMLQCTEFEAIFSQFERLDELDDDSKKDAFTELLKAARGAMRMGPATGNFFKERNTALLKEGMGFGEYTYIYVLAYRDQLRPSSSNTGSDAQIDTVTEEEIGVYTELADKPIGGRSRSRISLVHVQILLNQLRVAEETIDRQGDPDGKYAEIIRRLRREIHLIDRNPERLIWQDGPLTAAGASFTPYRAQLDSLFCERTVAFELVRNVQKGIGIQGD